MDLTSALQSVIDRASAKDPDERYQDAQEMLRDVQTILSQDPDAISSNIRGLNLFSSSKTQSTDKVRTSRPMIVPLICALAASLVIAGGVYYSFTATKGSTEAQEAEDRTMNPNVLLNQAGFLIQHGDVPSAITILERTVRSDRRTQLLSSPSRLLAYTLLAQGYQSQNQRDAARALAGEGLQLCQSEYAVRNSTIADLIEGYARLCDSAGESAKATEQYRLAVKVARKGPTDNTAKWRLRLMSRLLKDNQAEESLTLARQIIRDYRDQPFIGLMARLHVASVMHLKGTKEESQRAHQEAFAFEEKYRDEMPDPRANFMMGRAHLEIQQPEKAEEFFQRFEEMGPPVDAALDSSRSLNYALMGRPKKSVRYARQSADLVISGNSVVEPGVLINDLESAERKLADCGFQEESEQVNAQIKRIVDTVALKRQRRVERGRALGNTSPIVKETGP